MNIKPIFLSKSDDDDDDDGKNYIGASITAIIVIALTHWIAPGHIPIYMRNIWDMHGTNFSDWFMLGLPIFCYALFLNIIFQIAKPPDNPFVRRRRLFFATTRGEVFIKGFGISAFAGITEEIAFRWLIFLSGFTSVAITNFFFFGFLGFGIPEWFTVEIAAPLANWATLGYLESWLLNENWLLGAAIISSNAFFRDGHKYQGFYGIINSWFLGMFFFYVMFTHGLLAAILIHFFYDMCCFLPAVVFKR